MGFTGSEQYGRMLVNLILSGYDENQFSTQKVDKILRILGLFISGLSTNEGLLRNVPWYYRRSILTRSMTFKNQKCQPLQRLLALSLFEDSSKIPAADWVGLNGIMYRAKLIPNIQPSNTVESLTSLWGWLAFIASDRSWSLQVWRKMGWEIIINIVYPWYVIYCLIMMMLDLVFKNIKLTAITFISIAIAKAVEIGFNR